MLKRINQFIADFYVLQGKLEAFFATHQKAEMEKKLMRHLLGAIDLSDLHNPPQMSETQRKDMLGRLESSYYDLKQIGRQLIADAQDYMATQSDDLSFPRGTINGICLFIEKIDELHAEHNEAKPKKVEDKYKMLPELLLENSRSASPFPSVTPTSNE